MERLDYDDLPLVTLILTYSKQATRRAIRSQGPIGTDATGYNFGAVMSAATEDVRWVS